MALAVKQPGSYIAKYVYRLPERIETDKFKEAWNATVQKCGNLRTRIVVQEHASYQAIVKEEQPNWEATENDDLRSFMDKAKSMEMAYGSRLSRYALVTEPSTGERHFVLIIHHAVFDGWSLNVVLGTLHGAYHGTPETQMALRPYSNFINYTTQIDQEAAATLGRMTIHERATIIALPGREPSVPDSAYVLPNAVLAGDVRLGERVGIYPGASLRAEDEPIVVGDDTNVQDQVSCHVDGGSPLTIGARVSIGHNAVVHGCTIEDDVLVGMHATIMNGAVIGTGSLVAAGALVTQGQVVPPRSLVAGVPAKVRREVTDEELASIHRNASGYVERTAEYRSLA